MILTETNNIRFSVDASHKHSIDNVGDTKYYHYVFMPYAAFKSTLFQRHGEHLQIGNDESPALQFKRKELRIKLLQKIHAGHELDTDLFIMMNVGKLGSATIFNTNTLQWQMQSHLGSSEADKVPAKDFPSFFEKTFYLTREEAWRFSWVLVRMAYVEWWGLIDELLTIVRGLPTVKGRKREVAKQKFVHVLEERIHSLKNEVAL